MVHAGIVQQAFTAIVDQFIRTGRAPHDTALASLTGVPTTITADELSYRFRHAHREPGR
jgi:hypothetical protein